jgi:uncharacterized membrane protein
MQFLAIAALLFTSVNAHAIFQKISVNGVDKGTSTGIRIAQSNNVSASPSLCLFKHELTTHLFLHSRSRMSLRPTWLAMLLAPPAR